MSTTTHPAPADPVEAARAEVERLFAVEQEWSAKRIAAAAQVAEAERSAGAAALDGSDAGRVAGRIAGLRAELDVADHAIAEARARRETAVRAVWAAEAGLLRTRAATLRAEAAEREVRTRQLLDALAEHEGVEYAPVRPIAPPVMRGADGAPVGGVLTVFVPMPRTALLREEADGLERAAAARSAQQVARAGQVVAQDPDQLRADLATLGPMQLAPVAHAVEAWLAAGLERDRERRARLAPGPGYVGYRAPLVLQLVWRDGAIDPDRSRIGPPPGWNEEDEERAERPEREAAAAARAAREAEGRVRDVEVWNAFAAATNADEDRRARERLRVG